MRRLNAKPVVDDPPVAEKDSMDSLKYRPINRSPNLFSRAQVNNKNGPRSKLFLFSVVLISFTLLYFLFSGSRIAGQKNFRVLIDGGSTGTRIHVFEYWVKNGVPEFDFGNDGLVSMRVMPGLSAFADDPEKVGGSMNELVEFARKRVPKEYWGKTEIRLMATAGLRLVDGHVQEEILEACRKVLRLSGFKFSDNWASVISGSDEGLYAWVVANYARGSLGGHPEQTTGIIELGGASAQVTFVSSDPVPPEFSRIVKFGNSSYNLYSHSLLHYGQNVAFNLLKDSLLTKELRVAAKSVPMEKQVDPCTPRGYKHELSEGLSPSTMLENRRYSPDLHPSGNFSECRSASLKLLQKGREKCSYKHCSIGSTYIPKLKGKFLATENFFHTSKFFGLAPRAFLSDLPMAGKEYCQEDWSILKQKHPTLEDEDLLRFCFSSAYIVALLHDSLEISMDDHSIEYASQVGDIPLDWALGAFILQATTNSAVEDSSWIANIVEETSVEDNI
ncbi:hypothetical protein ACET3Z_007225 [Daucus carota]